MFTLLDFRLNGKSQGGYLGLSLPRSGAKEKDSASESSQGSQDSQDSESSQGSESPESSEGSQSSGT